MLELEITRQDHGFESLYPLCQELALALEAKNFFGCTALELESFLAQVQPSLDQIAGHPEHHQDCEDRDELAHGLDTTQ